MLMYNGPDTSVITDAPWREHYETLDTERVVYLDHATTSYPRAPGVLPAMTRILANPHGSPGRAARSTCISPDAIVDEVRAQVASFFGMSTPRRVIFTSGSTHALNLALKGFLAPGDHVVATCFEHNAVLRPLMQLQRAGVKVTIVRRPIPDRGLVDAVVREFRPETKLVVVNHASNVCGTILPVEDIGAAARAQDIRVLVDASQTAGHVPIDLGTLPVDMLAFSAHKGPLGPPGVGCLLVADESIELTPLVMGGTVARPART